MQDSRTLRFSRTVKTDVGGQGVTVALMMELEAVWETDPADARLALVDRGEGRLTIQLIPMPKNVTIFSATATAVDFSNPATMTSFVDVQEAIEEEKSEKAVLSTVGEMLTPPMVPPPVGRAALLSSVNDRPFQVF